jgi:hypothetical protein
MPSKHLTQIGLMILTAAVLLVPVASAQNVVNTYFEVETEESDQMDDWEGQAMAIGVQVRLCWDGPGATNPEGESFNVTAEVEAPSGYSANLDTEELNFTPPAGPTIEADCLDWVNITMTLEADNGAQENETLWFNMTLSEADGEPAGWFAPPSDNTTTIQVMTAEFIEEDPDDEVDTPAPAAVLLVAVLAIVLARFRRKG